MQRTCAAIFSPEGPGHNDGTPETSVPKRFSFAGLPVPALPFAQRVGKSIRWIRDHQISTPLPLASRIESVQPDSWRADHP